MFDSGCVKVFLDNIYYGFGFLFVNDDTSIYVVGNFNTSNDNDSIIWHAR